MNNRIQELCDRRGCLISQSAQERERAARCAESVTHFFSRNKVTRVVKASAGSAAGMFILRWLGRKLMDRLGGFWGRQASRWASGFWRR